MEFDLSFPTCYLHAILLCTTTIALSCLLILSFVFVTSLSYPNKLLGCALPSHFLSHLILDMEFDFSFHPSCLHGLLFCVPLPSSHFPPPPILSFVSVIQPIYPIWPSTLPSCFLPLDVSMSLDQSSYPLSFQFSLYTLPQQAVWMCLPKPPDLLKSHCLPNLVPYLNTYIPNRLPRCFLPLPYP